MWGVTLAHADPSRATIARRVSRVRGKTPI
jgi:hypothetical protein